ncbi:hypothetical protein GCM10022236_09600 [Microlunatus ginsengisoli]|uniref:Adenylylsulfate kinase n=2 Tax=Microlunatus ginsengisoli TaxID=363863 RepID=A0ABP6ZIR6_9ACTN
MAERRLPVLWLTGPPGAGKSTLGWELFDRLARDVRVGYVDLDQVGMCYATPTPDSWAPEPRGDYGRHRLQARNLNDLLPVFAAAGAAGVVVSGVVDARRGIDVELLPAAALTSLRLRVDPAELARRLRARARPDDDVEHVLRYAAQLDGLPGAVLDTTGTTVEQAVELVRQHSGDWPFAAKAGPVEFAGDAALPLSGRAASTAGPVLWLCGATGVGKSTVGWQLYEQIRSLGVRCAFVDLQQIGFLRPTGEDDAGNHGLTARNLAAVWANFRADGARGLLVVGSLDSAETRARYAAAMPEASIAVCRLHAGPDRFAERVALRGRGLGPPIAGDALAGQPADVLHEVAVRATAEAAAQQRAALGDVWIDTDRSSPREAAREILRRTDWLGLAHRL